VIESLECRWSRDGKSSEELDFGSADCDGRIPCEERRWRDCGSASVLEWELEVKELLDGDLRRGKESNIELDWNGVGVAVWLHYNGEPQNDPLH
jgi:hypothetical protein